MDEIVAGGSEIGIKVVNIHGSDDENEDNLMKTPIQYASVPPHDLRQSHESDSIFSTKSKDLREDSMDDVNLKEDSLDDVNLQQDTCSTILFYALLIFSMQMAIFVLAFTNLLNASDPGNPLKVPVANLTGVKVSHTLVLLMTVVTSTDISESLDVFHIQFDTSIIDKFPITTRNRWYTLNLIRFMLGFMCMVIEFLFIIQSTDVIDLLLDFDTVQFVSGLENLGFYLSDNGYSIIWMKHLTTQIKILSSREKKPDPYSCFSQAFIKNIISVMILLVPLSVWVPLTIIQDVGYYFDLNCQHFEVNLDNITYHYFCDHSNEINYT